MYVPILSKNLRGTTKNPIASSNTRLRSLTGDPSRSMLATKDSWHLKSSSTPKSTPLTSLLPCPQSSTESSSPLPSTCAEVSTKTLFCLVVQLCTRILAEDCSATSDIWWTPVLRHQKLAVVEQRVAV